MEEKKKLSFSFEVICLDCVFDVRYNKLGYFVRKVRKMPCPVRKINCLDAPVSGR